MYDQPVYPRLIKGLELHALHAETKVTLDAFEAKTSSLAQLRAHQGDIPRLLDTMNNCVCAFAPFRDYGLLGRSQQQTLDRVHRAMQHFQDFLIFERTATRG